MSKKNTRLADVANRAGVSIATASRALNDSPAINKRTKQAVWKVARELDYPFRSYMPAGPIGAEAKLAVVAPRPQGRDLRISDPFFLQLLAGLGEAARERGCDLLISHLVPASFEDLSAAMTTGSADGVIFVGQSWLHTAFNKLASEETRFVVWGAELPDQNYCCIGSDNFVGGRRATRHLLRLGRRRIVFLGDTQAPEIHQRHRGYLEALSEADIEPVEDLTARAHFDLESAEAAVDALIASDIAFDGVVGASDVIALGAIRALQRAGRRVPDDVSVVGYDNVEFGRYSAPALTTIDQDTPKAGRLLVSKLLDSSATDVRRSERLPPDLIIRDSCGG